MIQDLILLWLFKTGDMSIWKPLLTKQPILKRTFPRSELLNTATRRILAVHYNSLIIFDERNAVKRSVAYPSPAPVAVN